jgi:homocysteine S-methyltransferase
MVENLKPLKPDAILMNCAPPPDITRALEELRRHYSGPTGGYPHVGRYDPPDWRFTDEYPPPEYLAVARSWVEGGSTIVGGCCGTTPMHIQALHDGLRRTQPAPV